MIDIKTIDLPKLNNGAHYEFMKVVSDRFATETAGKHPMARSRVVMQQSRATVAMARITTAVVKTNRAAKVKAMPP